MTMTRLLIGSAASSLKIFPRRKFPLASSIHLSIGERRLHTPIKSTAPPKYPIRANHFQAPLRIQSITFSTNNDGSPPPSTEKSPKKRRGIFGRIRHAVRTLFGVTDDTPRGIQERQDMHWVVLAVAHRKLRIERQRKLLQESNDTHADAQPPQLIWQEESKEQLKDLMEEAVSHLDEKTDIGRMQLRRLRGEIQSFLEPQIIQLLNVAHDAEDELNVEDEDYIFSEEEEKEYKEILLREHENVCQLLTDCEGSKEADKTQRRTSDPVPFYEIKKGAIETLLTYYDWWPEDSSVPTISSTNNDKEEYVDEFGFSPTESDSEIISGMRYFHVRNLVRSSLVRRHPDIAGSSSKSNDNQHPHGYHSLLPFKSTIMSAGRGVYVDGFAPAGTLLAFIPGQVWPKEHLQSASLQTQMQFSQDPRHQLSFRYDDILIDSRQSPYTVIKNLWALGHIINHPPAPTLAQAHYATSKTESEKTEDQSVDKVQHHPHQGPNCVIVPINFTDRMVEGQMGKLREYIPNEYELPPKPWAKNAFEKDEIIMHGLGLVARRDVKDEELFYDYRLSPNNEKNEDGGPFPGWYYVWDQGAIDNRWDNDDS